jgi:hypothetical protein
MLKSIKKLFPKKEYLFLLVLTLTVLLVLQCTLLIVQRGRSRVAFRQEPIAGSTSNQVAAIATLASRVVFTNGKKQIDYNTEQLGGTLDTGDLSRSVDEASSWQNFVPLWGLKPLIQSKQIVAQYVIDKEKIQEASIEVAVELSYEPIDAHLLESEGQLTVEPESDGVTVLEGGLSQLLEDFFQSDGSNGFIVISGTVTEAKVTREQLVSVVEKYRDILEKSLSVSIDNTTFELSAADILSLIDVSSQSFALDTVAVDTLVVEWSAGVSKVPGVTEITYVDDIEIARTDGESGRFLDTVQAVEAIQAWFDTPRDDALIALTTTVANPKIIASRSYTASSLGLQKLIENWEKNNAGTYSIAIREIGGQAREASVNASTLTETASIYKMFLAVAAYTLDENNEISLGAVVYNGKTIEQCIEVAIVYSDNPCIVAAGWYIGWDKIDSTLSALGFSSTKLDNYNPDRTLKGAKISTAHDQAKLLTQLSSGSLLSASHTSSLLGYMRLQSHRDGIPAGSGGATVENKVGFLESYLHDMAIVRGSNTTYALAIMSDNSSWGRIEDLAQTVYEFLN